MERKQGAQKKKRKQDVTPAATAGWVAARAKEIANAVWRDFWKAYDQHQRRRRRRRPR